MISPDTLGSTVAAKSASQGCKLHSPMGCSEGPTLDLMHCHHHFDIFFSAVSDTGKQSKFSSADCTVKDVAVQGYVKLALTKEKHVQGLVTSGIQ